MFSDLVTSRLIVRRLVLTDAPALFHIRSQIAITQFQVWEPQSVDEVVAFIEEQTTLDVEEPDTWFQLAITLKETELLVGDCGLHFLKHDPHQSEIGFNLAPDQQGKGYATEALTAVLDFLFSSLGKHRVSASTDPRNEPAIKLLRALGMRQEALFRESFWFKGEWTDDLVFAILRSEWEAARFTG